MRSEPPDYLWCKSGFWNGLGVLLPSFDMDNEDNEKWPPMLYTWLSSRVMIWRPWNIKFLPDKRSPSLDSQLPRRAIYRKLRKAVVTEDSSQASVPASPRGCYFRSYLNGWWPRWSPLKRHLQAMRPFFCFQQILTLRHTFLGCI